MTGAKTKQAAKVDANQADIIKTMRKVGMVVEPIGMPSDLLVAKFFTTVIVEVKNPEQPPSKRRLTDQERDFWDRWKHKGLFCVIETDEDVLDLNRAMVKGQMQTQTYCHENMRVHFETRYNQRKSK